MQHALATSNIKISDILPKVKKRGDYRIATTN